MSGVLRGNQVAGGGYNRGAFAGRTSRPGPMLPVGDFNGSREIDEFLFGDESDLTDKVKSAIVQVNGVLTQHGKPQVSVHGSNHVDLVYPDTEDWECAVRISLDAEGRVFAVGSGLLWADEDSPDAQELEQLKAAGLTA
ncbi:hypothetical protein ACFVAJ_16815 [Agromyces sp. NPDC057679]|uniref:hypothetical protein n=1 Tax=Agromyces sp. NPDC057679 TaxID=3346207 RepID=UPI00366F7953